MKNLFKYVFVFVIAFAFFASTALAAKDTKKEESEKSDNNDEVVETIGADEESTGKVTLYLFRRTGCPHCIDELTYLDKVYSKYEDKLNIVVYNYYDEGNQELVSDVIDLLGVDPEQFGFPFNVIGSEQFMGFAESITDQFDAFIEDGIKANEKDIVAELIAKKKYPSLRKTTLSVAMDEEGIKHSSDTKSNDNVIIITIFVAVVVLTGALIFFSKRK